MNEKQWDSFVKKISAKYYDDEEVILKIARE